MKVIQQIHTYGRGLTAAAVAILILPVLLFAAPWSPGEKGNEAGASDFVVHEWGTFTSVSGSDGVLLSGLEAEEETLPYFVYSHDGMGGKVQPELDAEGEPKFKIMTKGFNRPLKGVTIKMETPVLYFYGPAHQGVEVNVGFRGGSISQWYPSRVGGETLPPVIRIDTSNKNDLPKVPDPAVAIPLGASPVDFSKGFEGSIQWKVDLKSYSSDTPFELMKLGESLTWTRPRVPGANIVVTQGAQGEEREGFLFYRGVGRFDLPVRFETSRVEEDSSQEILTLSPQAAGGVECEIPFLLLLHRRTDGLASLLWSAPLKDRETISLSDEAGEYQPFESLKMEAYQGLKTALMSAGLYEAEAVAMLSTWWESYTSRAGLRAFWVVPREFTGAILPLEVSPNPDQVSRVLLGRSEILTQSQEQKLLEAYKEDPELSQFNYDRYRQAYLKRVAVLTKMENR